MALTELDILTGTFNLLFVIISFIVGISILARYRKVKKVHFIYVGLIWIGICTPWLHGALTLIFKLLGGSMLEQIRFTIAYIFVPIIIVLWMKVFGDLVYPKKEKLLFYSYLILCVICEIIFFTFLFIDYKTYIGYFSQPFLATYQPFTRYTMMFFLASGFVTFMIFASKSLKSTDMEIQLKGKFLIIAMVTFTACSVLDSFKFFATIPIMIVITRIFLMLSAIEFYLGWILPNFIKKLFIKEK